MPREKNHVHCMLCNNQVISTNDISQHVYAVHKKHGVYGKKYFYWPCKTDGHKESGSTRSHYHCGFCNHVVSQKQKFLRHLSTHEKKRKAREMCDADELLYHPPTKKAQQGIDVQCKICNKILAATYLKTHMRVHDVATLPKSVCVDRERGIYMVPKSISHGGIRYPIHVQKLMRGNISKYTCEHENCIDHRGILERSGANWFSCPHLDLVDDKNTLIQDSIILSDEVLHGSISKIYKEEKRMECSDMNRKAISLNYVPVVPFFQSGDHVHLSVWSGENDNSCYKYNRVIVTLCS